MYGFTYTKIPPSAKLNCKSTQNEQDVTYNKAVGVMYVNIRFYSEIINC